MNEAILRALAGGAALTDWELADRLGENIEAVAAALKALEAEALVARTRRGGYTTPERAGLVAAEAYLRRSGEVRARALCDGRDMALSERGALRAMPGDRLLLREGRDGATIHAVTRRACERAVAVIGEDGRSAVSRKSGAFMLAGSLGGARAGDLARVRVTRYPEGGKPALAVVEETFGAPDDPRTRLRAIADEHGFGGAYPENARTEAENAVADDQAAREDLRNLCAFTIDGADAKDFDDAVSVEKLDGGLLRLGVHIADVSHYVRRGSAIDREALRRGTSLYLPGLTVPMLPERLCNDLCSLRPDEDRLAMSLMLTMDGAKAVDARLTPSVIRSRARLTYEAVNRLFGGSPEGVPEAVRAPLFDMLALSRKLREKRAARGAIDLDLPETRFLFGADGLPSEVCAFARGEAERVIEDFMLLANETVAEMAEGASLPFPYRVHARPDPERLRALEALLSALNRPAHVGERPHPGVLKRILDEAEGGREAFLLRRAVLRSMKRAQYAPAPEGHYALAARAYCHFTSPIRRYPDLEAHRMLKALLSGADTTPREAAMPGLTAQCSAREYEATLAERDADDYFKARCMLSHVGEAFDGVVASVTEWGAYILLANTCEGLAHVRRMTGNYELSRDGWSLVSGRTAIRVGDGVRVVVERADEQMGEIDFSLPGF